MKIVTKVWNNFTFYTYEKPGDINQLLEIKIFQSN